MFGDDPAGERGDFRAHGTGFVAQITACLHSAPAWVWGTSEIVGPGAG